MTKQVSERVKHSYDKENICKKCGQSKKANLHFKWDCRPIVKKVKSVKAWVLKDRDTGKMWCIRISKENVHLMKTAHDDVIQVLITEVK